MKDGLYIVDRGNIYGAFVIRDGEVHQCAPILRKNIGFYMKIAQYVPTNGKPVEEDSAEAPRRTQPSMTEAAGGANYPPPWRAGVE